MKIAGIYLAGGNSRRMGTSKIALPVGKMTLGSIALETVLQSAIDKVYVIVQQTDTQGWLPSNMKSHAKCSVIPCTTAHIGQSESLRCGIRQAVEDNMDAVIVFLADQPFITVQMINNMITCIKNSPDSKFIATSHDNTTYPPVLFTASMYHSLLELTGDQGARSLLEGNLIKNGNVLPCEDKRFIFDVDTKNDFEQFLQMKNEKRN